MTYSYLHLLIVLTLYRQYAMLMLDNLVMGYYRNASFLCTISAFDNVLQSVVKEQEATAPIKKAFHQFIKC